jgi:hypothetical protein
MDHGISNTSFAASLESNSPSFQDDESSVSGDSTEALELLLGGITIEDLSPDAWENESNHGEDDETVPAVNANGTCANAPAKKETAPKRYTIRSTNEMTEGDTDPIFFHAYKCTPNGRVQRPSVQVVDLSAFQRGNILITTAAIPRGETIYTERAAIESQIPEKDEEGRINFAVRACQHCFRSLAPVSSCQTLTDSAPLPLPDLWPVPAFDFENDISAPALPIRRDRYGRVVCKTCHACFCSEHCRTEQIHVFGSCCTRTKALTALPTIKNSDRQVQSAVALAVCMFGMSLHHYRRTGSCDGTALDGLCGDAKDIAELELGMAEQDSEGRETCSLKPVYTRLIELFDMTDKEQSVRSLQDLHEMASKAARNGVGIRTQSPFKTYYASLLRQAGGRGSDKHEQLMVEVANALGSDDGNLERGMDRVVEERVAPEVVALFPLTARMNHSCAPNAEVRSQEFVDCHMNLVAKRDIAAGEELLISYIGVGPSVGRKSRYRRRRELQAKYLFWCECRECQQETSSPSSATDV